MDDRPARAKEIRYKDSPESEGYCVSFESRLGKLVVPVSIVGLPKPEISSLKEIGRCPWEECEQGSAKNIPGSEGPQKAFAEGKCESRDY